MYLQVGSKVFLTTFVYVVEHIQVYSCNLKAKLVSLSSQLKSIYKQPIIKGKGKYSLIVLITNYVLHEATSCKSKTSIKI